VVGTQTVVMQDGFDAQAGFDFGYFHLTKR
jgi:hypothetical protein